MASRRETRHRLPVGASVPSLLPAAAWAWAAAGVVFWLRWVWLCRLSALCARQGHRHPQFPRVQHRKLFVGVLRPDPGLVPLNSGGDFGLTLAVCINPEKGGDFLFVPSICLPVVSINNLGRVMR